MLVTISFDPDVFQMEVISQRCMPKHCTIAHVPKSNNTHPTDMISAVIVGTLPVSGKARGLCGVFERDLGRRVWHRCPAADAHTQWQGATLQVYEAACCCRYPPNAVTLRISIIQGMTPLSRQAESLSAPNGPVLDVDVCQLYASAAQQWRPAAFRHRTSLCLQGALLLRHLNSHSSSSSRPMLLQTPRRPGCSRQCVRDLMAPLRIHRRDLTALQSEGHTTCSVRCSDSHS